MIEPFDNIKTGLQALNNIDDTYYDDEKAIIEKELKVLEILKRSPFILENLAKYSTNRKYNKKYFFGTITDSERDLVEEYFYESR